MNDKIHKPHLTMNEKEVKDATTYDDPFGEPLLSISICHGFSSIPLIFF